MPFVLFIIVVLVLVFAIGPGKMLYVVPQQQAFIVERLGKFKNVGFAGLNTKAPFIDKVVQKTNLRVTQLTVKLETKTLDNVFVNVTANIQFRVDPNNVAKAYYELRDPESQMRSYMEDALRSAIPTLTLDDSYSHKDDVAAEVQKTVSDEMNKYGFTIIKTLVTDIEPNPQVKNAMDSINAAQREKEATRQRAESMKIQIESQAAAEAEKTRLQGEGQANYRREIANGIVDQIKSLQEVGMDIDSVNNVVLFNQYLDVMRNLSESSNAKTVILPASTPGGFNEMYEQMTKSMVSISETHDDAKPAPVRRPAAHKAPVKPQASPFTNAQQAPVSPVTPASTGNQR